MGDQFLKCLNNLRTIREIYLEAPELLGARPNRAFLKDMLRGANVAPPKTSNINRASTFCLQEFRPCDKTECSFRPSGVPDLSACANELYGGGGSGNMIVVSPFEVAQNRVNDVRVHVLYGNQALFEFERQTQHRQNGTAQPPLHNDDDFASDDDEDENEILYNDVKYMSHHLPLFYESTVSDDGIRWFTASDTNANDYTGQESLLFRRQFVAKCECAKQREDSNEDWDKPGPSGLNKERGAGENEEEEFQPPPIIAIPRRCDIMPRQNRIDIVLPMERRDLRVVIERVEPGVQIIVNNNNNNNAMFQNNLTRLEVFVVRNFNRLTDRAIQNLSGIRLELLDVTGTSISADAVKRFLLLNPDCRVIHESTCRCKPDR